MAFPTDDDRLPLAESVVITVILRRKAVQSQFPYLPPRSRHPYAPNEKGNVFFL